LPDENVLISDLVIDQSFDWKMEKNITIDINVIENDSSKLGIPSIYVEIFDNINNGIIFKGLTNSEGNINVEVTVPSSLSELSVRTNFKDTLVAIDAKVLECTLNTDHIIVDNNLDITRSSSRASATNLITNPGFSTNSYDSSTKVKDKNVDLDKWYYKEKKSSSVYAFPVYKNSDWVMKVIKATTSRESFCAQVIDDVTVGKTYRLEVDGKILSGLTNNKVSLQLQFCENKLDKKPKSTYEVKDWTSSWKRQGVTATAPSKTEYIRVVLYIDKHSSNGSILFDNITLAEWIDTDDDGICDSNDDYPNDDTKAFDNFYPSDNTKASLAFEDLWPYKGDYEFNDLVVDYQMNPITNADNKVVVIENYITVKAIGASFHSGLGIELPVLPSVVNTVTGQEINGNYISLSSNNTEANQTNAVIILFDDAFDLLPHPGNGCEFVNTTIGETYVTPQTIQIDVKFSTPQTISSLGTPPYNPFMIIDQTRNKEIHLANYPPTDLASTSLLGSGHDDSKPSQNRYYVTKNNLPWVINTPYQFKYPKEKVEITSAHLKFAPWAVSIGVNYTEWYKDKNGYRSDSNIYSH
ncbi:MAG: LruC domain-containing protein, partial [Bacteroidota bacterium]|nr:LruC domain-containing protein [Bacteroidota bacterium]